MKYTKEVLEPLVQGSLSVAEVMRKLGMRHLDGGTHSHISRQIRKFGIDTSHLLGKARQRGTISNHKLPWQKILVRDRLNGRKECTPKLRRAMIESGIEYRCGTCGIAPVWNNKNLVLQISHKDGNSVNDEKDNLHFECPNCHSQTDDFSGRSAGKKRFKASANSNQV
jgi:predicted RNA-binding Zn-ribbon protein involved in translation (DUF1610 family)